MLRHVAVAVLVVLMPLWPGAAAAGAPPPMPAPVEARVPFAPQVFTGSDGQRHLAYELHISNFYGDTGPLLAQGLQVFADGATAPLLVLDQAALAQQLHPAPAGTAAPSIAAGKRGIVFVWLSLPATAAVPQQLRHHVEFETEAHSRLTLDGATVAVNTQAPLTIGPPLRGGRWLAHEGPGSAQSHHWGSLVAVNGELTIPQRFALDLVGVADDGRVLHAGVSDLQHTRHRDWVGYGWEVTAVADGVVRAVRDGQPDHPPLTAQPEPTALSADGLFGNYVVLELAPGVFASYAHLRTGSVRVKPGDRVQRGQRLAQLGQSGNSAAPHLHFQLSNKASFEGAEGIPYVFEHFQLLGAETEAQLFGQGEPWQAGPPQLRQRQLPLNDVVVSFPDR